MEIAISTVNQFTNAIRDEYGCELKADEANDALEWLSKFFDLLDQFDREDRQNAIQMKRTPYATRI